MKIAVMLLAAASNPNFDDHGRVTTQVFCVGSPDISAGAPSAIWKLNVSTDEWAKANDKRRAELIGASCEKRIKLIKAAEAELTGLKNKVNALELACLELIEKIRNSSALTQLNRELGLEARQDAYVAYSCSVESGEESSSPALIKAVDAYNRAKDDMAGKEALVESARDRFVEMHRAVFYAASETGLHTAGNFEEGTREQVTLVQCDPGKSDLQSRLLDGPKNCMRFAEASSAPRSLLPQNERLRTRGGPQFLPSITTGQNGSNAELKVTGTFDRFSAHFPEGEDHRRPKSLTWSAGIEAKAEDGIANIIGGNSSDANFFSLDRLSSTLIGKGSLGFNFFPRQSKDEYERLRRAFIAAARKACKDTLNSNKTSVATNCRDEYLLVWLYERKDGDYARSELVEKFEKLIWNSSAEYPEFGTGLSFSWGLRDQTFHRFSDEDRKFVASEVDEDRFFLPKTDVRSDKFDSINDKFAFTGGVYGYRHFAFNDRSHFKGITLRADATWKYDLEDLSKKEIEICKTDISAIGAAGVFRTSDRCKKTVPFEPQFETTFVPKVELRLATKPWWRLPEMGFAPNVSAQFKDGLDETLRFELPVYFTAKGSVLSGGVGIAHEIDFERTKDKAETSVFIFVGREFSLDGSK